MQDKFLCLQGAYDSTGVAADLSTLFRPSAFTHR